jgi:hypothetical protein
MSPKAVKERILTDMGLDLKAYLSYSSHQCKFDSKGRGSFLLSPVRRLID